MQIFMLTPNLFVGHQNFSLLPTAAAVADIKQRTTLPQIHKWIDHSRQKVQKSGGSGKLKYVEFNSKGDFSIEFKKTIAVQNFHMQKQKVNKKSPELS